MTTTLTDPSEWALCEADKLLKWSRYRSQSQWREKIALVLVAARRRGIEEAAQHVMMRQYTHLCSSCGLNDGEYEERSIEVRTAKRIAAGIRALASKEPT